MRAEPRKSWTNGSEEHWPETGGGEATVQPGSTELTDVCSPGGRRDWQRVIVLTTQWNTTLQVREASSLLRHKHTGKGKGNIPYYPSLYLYGGRVSMHL